ncbi:OpgC domain-containing protein [Rhizobium sp. Root1220]|uniref:OpgC domain-containing protein n=1 Tax=Rhizobium sp. Root1220 TaxID=1736432 RepID=UPI0006F81950|nr:OpgC domain-containing protein [Rhizobium sp. Root1220]KQV66177.1 hypothetical protein ASC90_13340 [Rhizobium sp. Root1220]
MRDIKLDLIRGVAMITIAINHFGSMIQELGYDSPKIPTLTTVGYSSAAEIFFVLSGYMIGLVYLKKDDYARRIRYRSWELYKHNLAAFIAAMLVACLFPAISEVVSAQFTLDRPLVGSLTFLAFFQHPDLLGVLQLYVVLMLVTPSFVWLLRRSPALAVATSVAVYGAAQLVPVLNLPGGSPEGDWQWNFNPFAWQLLFFLGIVAGKTSLHVRLSNWLSASPVRASLVITAFVGAALYHRLALWGYVPGLPADKETLSPIRVVHSALAIMFLFSIAVLLGDELMNTRASRVVSAIGQSTLLCYTLSIPLTYAMAGIWLAWGGGVLVYLTGVATILVCITAAAHWGKIGFARAA